jgi:hypothetical protein
MNHEPLKPDPRWFRAQAASAYAWQSDAGGPSLSHPPAAYAHGFEDGAYALARNVLALMVAHKDDEAIKLLLSYNAHDARPARGWEHEPKRN